MRLWASLILVVGVLTLRLPALAVETERVEIPGFNPILDQALKGEAGVQVYMDKAGNVGTVLDAGPEHRTFSVQPPISPSFNFGPPLQLPNKSLSFPPTPPASGDQSPATTPTR